MARLQSELDLNEGQARGVRALCAVVDDPDALQDLIEAEHENTDDYVGRLYSNPYRSAMWRRTVVLYAIDVLIGTFGVECLGSTENAGRAPDYEYCNAGDSYAATLIYTRRNGADSLMIGSWADIAEKM